MFSLPPSAGHKSLRGIDAGSAVSAGLVAITPAETATLLCRNGGLNYKNATPAGMPFRTRHIFSACK
jgi:hypothetical protein